MELKSSSGDFIQTNHLDWELAKIGTKTATSRYGNRVAEYPDNSIKFFVSNECGGMYPIRILRTKVCTLKDVTSDDAKSIGSYSWVDHVNDFYGIYHDKLGREVNENTVLTVVYFSVVPLSDYDHLGIKFQVKEVI
jgi:hypothetical protein